MAAEIIKIDVGKNCEKYEGQGLLIQKMKLEMDFTNHVETFEELIMLNPFDVKHSHV